MPASAPPLARRTRRRFVIGGAALGPLAFAMTAHRCCLYCMSPAALWVAASRRRLLVDAFNNAWAAFVPSVAPVPGLSARFALPAKIQLAGWASYRLARRRTESLGHLVVYGTPRRPRYGPERPSSRTPPGSARGAPGPMLAACRTPRRLAGGTPWFVELPSDGLRPLRGQALLVNVSAPGLAAAHPCSSGQVEPG